MLNQLAKPTHRLIHTFIVTQTQLYHKDPPDFFY